MTTRELALAKVRAAKAAGEQARRHRERLKELQAFGSGAVVVFSGLLLAAVYCLLTQRIPLS